MPIISNLCGEGEIGQQRKKTEESRRQQMTMRLRGQALAMSSSSHSLLCRVPSFISISPCSSSRRLVSYRGFRIAPPPARARARLELRGTSPVVSRSRLSSVVSMRASHQASDAGSIDSSMMQSMENKIKEQLNADTVIVKDAYGDGRHVSIYAVSTAFEGQSAVNRQRMVYKAIWEELQSTVHAVDQMVTHTPAEANKNQ